MAFARASGRAFIKYLHYSSMITKAIIRRLATLMVALMALGATAQTLPQLPLDSAVVTGTLPNGLTYYIRHNEKPKGQAALIVLLKD